MTQLAYSRTSKQRNQHVRNFLSLLRTLYSSSCTCISLFFFNRNISYVSFSFLQMEVYRVSIRLCFHILCVCYVFKHWPIVVHFQLESAHTVSSVPSSCCLQAPGLVQQLRVCCYAQRCLRHPTKARVHKRNSVGNMHNLQFFPPLFILASMKPVQS